MKITFELLQRLNACPGQLGLFNTHFPDGVEMTVESLRYAEECGLDIAWLKWRLPQSRLSLYWESYKKPAVDRYTALVAAFESVSVSELTPAKSHVTTPTSL